MGKYNFNFMYAESMQDRHIDTQQRKNLNLTYMGPRPQSSDYRIGRRQQSLDQSCQTPRNLPLNYSTTLKFQGDYKHSKSVQHFSNNKIRSASYIRQIGYETKAIPFYERPEKIKKNIMPELKQGVLNVRQQPPIKSTNSDTYRKRNIISVGNQFKPLLKYDPNASRNNLCVQDLKQIMPNKSQIVLGGLYYKKQFVSTLKNDYGRKGKAKDCVHPAIRAFKFKFDHKQRDK